MEYENNNGVLGNSIDINMNSFCNAAEIKADIKVEEHCSKRIWGQVVNCYGEPISNVLVKLLKVENKCGYQKYVGVAHTVSDCEGFYQFDVCKNEYHECYKIIVNKVITGEEITIDTKGGNCNACCKKPCCNEHCHKEPIVVPMEKCHPPLNNMCCKKSCEKDCHHSHYVKKDVCNTNYYVSYNK